MQQSLQGLVADRLVDAHAADLGLTVADATLAERIRDDQLFRGATGFDRERVALVARSLGLTEDAYLETIRAELLRRELLAGITAPLAAPMTLARQMWIHGNEARRGRALIVGFAAIEVGEPEEATLAAYLERTKERWQTAERRKAVVALLRPADLLDEIAVEEDAVRAEYEARIGEFRTPERREVTQLLAPDEATAKAAAELVAGGKTFAEAAAALADKGVSSGSLGAMTRGQLPPELAAPIFALATGEVGAPAQSPFGWHLFRLDAVAPERTEPFETVKEELRRQLALQQAADRLPDLANVLEDAIAGGASLEDAAAEAGADLRRLDAIDPLGRDREGNSLLDDGLDAAIVAAIFAAAEGDLSLLGETAGGGYYMFRVDAIEPARTKPLDEVREALTEAWKADQRAEAARAKAKDLLARAKAGESLEALQAATPGTAIRPVGPVRRDETAPVGLEPAAVAPMFRTEPGKVAEEVAELRDGVAVLAVDAADRPEPPADLQALRARLSNDLRGDLLAQYEAALRLRYQPTVNERVLGAMIQAEEG
jgi:peptidyl-prolyl cis-trans isomerase D